ncbi:hypothetical protein [Actinokineospora globicatena]|uniref:hypothetical protein n=1 Tax=Actinokineospora globicatena TaxID=103729 RepID=UPI0020A44F58|nr:hypothetical protein [Actinokineospora globicatena]MCP2302742.1 hypothetical protein [Actinokineospora globicatena]GLW75568.1 hypothetical protein Aglo01_00500 [Actinokineospora globicatena]GLW82408.1 hypothetical protein Aglo02_00490 [Actinokineospora globicatena]
MGRERAVAVRGQAGERGSGCVVAPGLVLASARVCGAVGSAVKVGGMDALDGSVVWAGTPGGRNDAALVSVDGFVDIEPVKWGRFATHRPGQACEVWGGCGSGVRQATGQVRQTEDRYTVRGRSLATLQGSTGAGVFVGDVLVGVVAAHPQGPKLVAVPTDVLWDDGAFLAALGASGRLVAAEFEPLAVGTGRMACPSALVLARHEIAPWQPRPEIMASLHAWLARPGYPVWLLHGPAGQGKTRLALRLGQELPASWLVFWPDPDADPDALRVVADSRHPTLVVLDHAETRLEQLSVLATANVKVLLLARTHGEWWEHVPGVGNALVGATIQRLDPLTPTADRRKVLASYANALPRVDGRTAKLPARDKNDHPLTWHLTALADLLDAAAPPQHTADHTAEGRVLFHERRHWEKTAKQIPALATLDRATLHNAVALLALAGLSTPADAEPVLQTLPGLSAGTVHALITWFGTLYPPTSPRRAFDAPEPHRLAEHHVARQVHATPDLTTRLVAVATPPQVTTLLTVLTRALAHGPHHDHLAAHITALITANPDTLAVPALVLMLTTEFPDPLLAALHTVVASSDTTATTLIALGAALPRDSKRLAYLAADITGGVARHRRSGSTELAQALSDHAGRLSKVGRHEDAVVALEEAAATWRELELRDEDVSRLAECLTSLKISLARVGRAGDGVVAATEALRLFRALAASDSERVPRLVRAVEGLASALHADDRYEDALAVVEEAVVLARALARRDPDVHLHTFSLVLSTLSFHLLMLHRDQPMALVEEGLAIRRELANRNPIYLDGLGLALSHYALDLVKAGRAREGMVAIDEALEIQRALAASDPLANSEDLARSVGYRRTVVQAVVKAEKASARHWWSRVAGRGKRGQA